MVLRFDLYATGLNRYLRKVISADKLAGTGLNHVVEEDLADGVVTVTWFTVIKNGKEGRVKLIVEDRIGCLAN